MPKLPRTIMAVAGAAVTAALAYPPSRKQLLRTARATVDELLLRTEIGWTSDLILVTSEGYQSGLPRTSVLSSLTYDGELYVVPWTKEPDWFKNMSTHPDVIVDDRVKVTRARAEVVEGEQADLVREAYLEKYVPGPVHSLLARTGALTPGTPVVRLNRD